MSLFNLFFRDDHLEKLANTHPALFPLGAEQLGKESRILRELLHNRLSLTACQILLVQLKAVIHEAAGITDKKDLRERLRLAAGATLTPEEVDRVLAHLTGLNGTPYSTDDGLSVETAVQIHTTHAKIGIELEQRWLQENLGRKYQAWQTQDQSLYQRDGRYYDVFVLTLSDGSERTVVFDITSFFQVAERA